MKRLFHPQLFRNLLNRCIEFYNFNFVHNLRYWFEIIQRWEKSHQSWLCFILICIMLFHWFFFRFVYEFIRNCFCLFNYLFIWFVIANNLWLILELANSSVYVCELLYDFSFHYANLYKKKIYRIVHLVNIVILIFYIYIFI